MDFEDGWLVKSSFITKDEMKLVSLHSMISFCSTLFDPNEWCVINGLLGGVFEAKNS